MMSSIWSGVILSSIQRRMCACGKPLFCHSTEYIQHRTVPYARFFTMKSIKHLSFGLNTRAVTSWRSLGDWPGCNNCIASKSHKQIRPSIIAHVSHRVLGILVHVSRTANVCRWQNCELTNVCNICIAIDRISQVYVFFRSQLSTYHGCQCFGKSSFDKRKSSLHWPSYLSRLLKINKKWSDNRKWFFFTNHLPDLSCCILSDPSSPLRGNIYGDICVLDLDAVTTIQQYKK